MGRELLLVVDMVTPWDYPGAEKVTEGAEKAVSAIAGLKAGMAGKALIAYANDLDESFHGSREAAIERAMEGERPDLVEPILPGEDDSFIHKGQHSAFYGTPLAHLLKVSGVEQIVLIGQVTEQCILYTALDAHVRGYRIKVPVDAVISQRAHLGAAALEMIAANMNGELTTCEAILGGGG